MKGRLRGFQTACRVCVSWSDVLVVGRHIGLEALPLCRWCGGCVSATRKPMFSDGLFYGFAFVFAQVVDDASVAEGFLRLAGVAAVEDEPVVGVEDEFFRDDFDQFVFHFAHVFSRGEVHAVGDAEDVGIYGHRGLAEGGVEDDVGGFRVLRAFAALRRRVCPIGCGRFR